MENKDKVFLEEIENMLTELNMALKGFQIYPAGHPSLKNISVKISRLLLNLLENGNLNISLIGQDLVANGLPFLNASGVIENFKQEMKQRKMEAINFLTGLKEREIKDFIEVFSFKNWQEELNKKNLEHIKIGKISALVQSTAKETSSEEKVFQKVYQENLARSREIVESVETLKKVESKKVNTAVESILQSLLKDQSAFFNLNRIKGYDDYTFRHCIDVCMLSLIQGQALNFPQDKLLELGVSAFLHDLGKIFVPKQILNKPARLTLAEEAVIRKHPIEGAKVLQQTKGITPLSAVVAFEHHIYYNLQTGYPKLKQKRRLSLFTMIVSIADVYDALTTLRPYRQPFLPYQALDIISKSSGTQFEPLLVNNFMHLLGPYPIGSFVRLNTNELGFVWKLNIGKPPWVRIIFDSDGNRIENFPLIDLSMQEERKIASYDNPLFKGITAEEVMSA